MSRKIIYEPKGRALEYARYAANFFVGCSGKCNYCYNRNGRGAKILGGDKPELKKGLNSPLVALITFEKELQENLEAMRQHGVFFNFVSDPCLRETWDLNSSAMRSCFKAGIPAILLTKQTWWIPEFISEASSAGTWLNREIWQVKRLIAFGFTLTGHDSIEPGCATNAERIEGMKILSEKGFKTWASIEPVIDFESSFRMIEETLGFCSLYKVGLQSGKNYDTKEGRRFVVNVLEACWKAGAKVHLKNSIIKSTALDRDPLRADFPSCVNADFKLFQS